MASSKADHHVIFGLALITVGVFGVIGSVTGQLAVMLAALFDPGDLSLAGSGSTGTAPPAVGSAPGGEPTDEEPTEPTTPGLNSGTPEVGTGEGGILGEITAALSAAAEAA